MIPGVTKVLSLHTSGYGWGYQEHEIYTYLRNGNCGRGQGIVTVEKPTLVLIHKEYILLEADSMDNQSALVLLKKEE